ncbi:MAG: hypothetical protein ACRERY_10760, partial [Pseudomonas sp.]
DLGAPREHGLDLLGERLAAFDLGSLEDSLFGAASRRAVLEGLAELLQGIAEASGQISDRLALRYFAHVDASQQTMSS